MISVSPTAGSHDHSLMNCILDSTHGTFINKMRVKPRVYVRVRVGHQLKLGNSTRKYILQGPSEDEEEESEFTITELKQQKAEKEAELRQREVEAKLEHEKAEKEKESAGISWGMAEDAEEEPDLTENPFAVTTNEELFLDDPKKTLRGFFEREGYELEYKCDELSPGVFICRVELPIDDEYGKNIMCEVQHKGKKKECVVQCALEACRILDRHGVLRQANHEARRAKKIGHDSDSDDDNFFDRTGDVEKKRLKKLGPTSTEAVTYEQLVEQEKGILDKIQSNEQKLQEMVQAEKRQRNDTEEDLDAFMSNLSSMDSKVDKFAISTIKTEIQSLKIEHQKVRKLINIAKPSIALPPIVPATGKLPLFGKRNMFGRNFGAKKVETPETVKRAEVTQEIVEEEDEVLEVEAKVSVLEDKPVPVDQKPLKKSEPPVEAAKSSKAVPLATEVTRESSPKKPKLDEVSSLKEAPPKSLPPSQESSQESASKKRKTRVRVRNRLRQNIDMNDDDEYIDEEKVSTWVAPSDQTGDGTTHLNEKFGY